MKIKLSFHSKKSMCFKIIDNLDILIIKSVVLILFGAYTLPGNSQTIWLGQTNSDWHTASNWNTGMVPDATSEIEVFASPNNPVISAANTAVCRQLRVLPMAGLTINGTLNIDQQVSPAVAMTIFTEVTVNGTVNITNASTGLLVREGGILQHASGTINLGMTGNPLSYAGLLNAASTNINGTLNIGSAVYGIRNEPLVDEVPVFSGISGSINIAVGNHVITGAGIINFGHFINATPITIKNSNYGIYNYYVSDDDLTDFQNSGIIDMDMIQLDGIYNEDDFMNNTGGNISINNTGRWAIYNTNDNITANHEFVNQGDILIGQNNVSQSIGADGILNNSNSFIEFTSTSNVTIDQITQTGIRNIGTLENQGHINIGQSMSQATSVNRYGIENNGKFQHLQGLIKIDRANLGGLVNFKSGLVNPSVSSLFENNAEVQIGLGVGAATSVTNDCLLNNDMLLVNLENGIIQIRNCGVIGLSNYADSPDAATITNYGQISIGESQYGLTNNQIFNNEACAEIILTEQLRNTQNGKITNEGYIQIDYNEKTHVNSASITNNGIFYYALDNPVPAVVNNEIIIEPQTMTAEVCLQLELPDFLIANSSNMILSFWQDFNLTESAGVFDLLTGTLDMTTAFSPPSTGASILYVQIFDPIHNCSEVIFWVVQINIPDSDNDNICDDLDLCPNDRDVSLLFKEAGTASDYVEVPNATALNLTDGDFAFEAWINPVSGDYKTIVSKGDGGGGGPTSYIFGIMSDDDPFYNQPSKLGLFLTQGAGEWEFSNTSIPQNMWSHVAVSIDNSGANPVATFYYNGSVDGVKTFALSNPYNTDTGPFYIGRQGAGCQCNHFDGRIDELAVWDKTLSAVDVAASMGGQYVGSETGLIAYYDFNDADACVGNDTNTILIDKANNHNGTLINFDLNFTCSSNWAPGHNQGACQPGGCPPNLDLTGTQSINSDFISGGYISSNQTITSPTQVDYNASTEISLFDNFEVKVGATFHAFIEGCIPNNPQALLNSGYNVSELLASGYSVQDLLGLNHEGGIIFHIDANSGTGLVFAQSVQGTAAWGCHMTNVPGADDTSIGSGSQNTADIISAACNSAGTAASICADLVLNGYDDWFLPSIDELIELRSVFFQNTRLAGGTQVWSSSESSANEALIVSFYVGGPVEPSSKTNDYFRVRPVRAF